MNTERLYTIAKRVVSDLAETSAIGTLSALNNALRAQMSTPSPENIAQIEQRLGALEELKSTETFQYPETWNATLEHIGASHLKDAAFVEQVRRAVKGNSITLESASTAVAEMVDRLNTLNASLSAVVKSFDQLGLESYELSADEAELSVLMPREAFDNELKRFSKDLLEITRFIELAEEISTGSRTPPQLDELSTTDPIIIAGLTAPACLFVLKVVKDIIEIIKSTYELRETRAKALAAEASTKVIKALDEDITQKIDAGLKAIAEKYTGSKKGRALELRVELSGMLPKIAARLDNGYRIEGAAGPSATDHDGADSSDATAINALSTEISYRQLPDAPVLSITFESGNDDQESLEAPAAAPPAE